MHIRKVISLFVVIALLTSYASLFSHDLHSLHCSIDFQNDADAKKILDNVKDKYFGYNDITIDFKLEIQLAERPKRNETGQIIQQGEMFKVVMNDQDIYCNGEDLWYHLKTKNEVQINDYEGGEDIGVVSPADLLKQYESGEFEYALFKEYKAKGKNIAEIEFKPNEDFSDYSKLRVVIDKDAALIREVLAFGKDGSRFKMIIQTETYNRKYPNSTFEFDPSKFPDVIVEDLRLD